MSSQHWAWWLAALAVLGFWTLGAYNRVMALRAAVVAAWLLLDALIQARHQTIGALLDAIEPSLPGEQSTISAMVAAQVRLSTAAEVVRRRPVAAEPLEVLAKAEMAAVAALLRLVALVGRHSTLKADAAVAPQLQALTKLAPRERFARQAFNDAADAYNRAVTQFPTWLLSRIFGFERAGRL